MNRHKEEHRQRKRVVLIRHGESLGQTASVYKRSKDPSLIDCFLSKEGFHQALQLRQNLINNEDEFEGFTFGDEAPTKVDYMQSPPSFDLVVVSPLTRAITTCVLGLGYLVENVETKPSSTRTTSTKYASASTTSSEASTTAFICHPSLSELGSIIIPENRGRPIPTVIKDIRKAVQHYPSSKACLEQIDFTLVPSCWPDREHTEANKKKSKDKKSKHYFKKAQSNNTHVQGIYDRNNPLYGLVEWLYQRPETNIAVVCHYNIILNLTSYKVNDVPNCTPIVCDFERISFHDDNRGTQYSYILNPVNNSTNTYLSG